MKRRQKGTGTIIKVKGFYYGRIMVKGKVKVVRLSANLRESESLWKDWLIKNVSTLKTDAVKHKLNELWPLIKNNLIGQGLPNVRIEYHRRMYENIVEWIEANRRSGMFVEDIDKGLVLDALDALTKECSSTKKGDYLSAMRQIFKASGLSKTDVLDGIRVRKTPTKSREPFTDEEIKMILDKAKSKGASWYALVQIGLYTGLRLKDCVHLKVEDVKESVIETVPFKTKHHGTIVRIPLHPKLKEVLDSLEVKKGYYLPDVIDSYKRKTITERLDTIFSVIGDTRVKLEGRKRKVSVKGFHALRATFITRLAESGVSLPIMESLAGHLNAKQTMHYTHPNEDVKKVAISTLPDFVNKTEGSPFVHPEVQKVIDICKKQIEETIERVMGKKVEVSVSAKKILGGEDWFFNEL